MFSIAEQVKKATLAFSLQFYFLTIYVYGTFFYLIFLHKALFSFCILYFITE